jgi:hypothetical protein
VKRTITEPGAGVSAPSSTSPDESAANWYARKLAGIESASAPAFAPGRRYPGPVGHRREKALRTASRPRRANGHGRTRQAREQAPLAPHLFQGTFAFRTVPATLRVDDTAARPEQSRRSRRDPGRRRHYRRHALDTLNADGEILPGCITRRRARALRRVLRKGQRRSRC